MKQDKSLDSQSLRDTEKGGGESISPRLLNMGRRSLKRKIDKKPLEGLYDNLLDLCKLFATVKIYLAVTRDIKWSVGITKVSSGLKEISKKDRILLMYRFGLFDGLPKTLEETGKVFNITRERARQIEVKILKKLRSII